MQKSFSEEVRLTEEGKEPWMCLGICGDIAIGRVCMPSIKYSFSCQRKIRSNLLFSLEIFLLCLLEDKDNFHFRKIKLFSKLFSF